MKKAKIEVNILWLIVMEAIFLFFFFKEKIINFLLGSFINILLIPLIKKIKPFFFIKIFSLIISTVFLLLSLIQTIDFISLNLLKNYSVHLISFSVIMISYLIIYKGYHHFIKSLEIGNYFFAFFKIISIICLIPMINFNNFEIKELTSINIKAILSFAIFSFFVQYNVFFITKKEISTTTLISSTCNITILKLLTELIIGEKLLSIYQYPYFNVLKQIKYLDFFERMEGLLSFEFLFAFFFFIAFLILIIKSLFKN